MAIITITRGVLGSGEEVAQAVADALGARCVSLELLRETAKKYGVPQDKMEDIFETAPTFWERMTESRRVYLAYVQATLADWAKDDNLVYHGLAGQELLREVPHVLKVQLTHPLEASIAAAMTRFKCTRDQAARQIEHIQEERTKRTRYLYNEDWRDSRRYDVTINIDRLSAEQARELILTLARQPEFTLDEAKVAAFQDYLVKTRVYALLAGALVGRLSLITVGVRNGVVVLEGAISSPDDALEDLTRQIGSLAGVRSVDNRIVSGMAYQEWSV
jgi:cytidylate kinase